MLHIIKSVDAIEQSLQLCLPNDQLIFVESAVYGLINQKVLNNGLKDHLDHCFVLAQDSQARGLNIQALDDSQFVDFEGFVRLTELHEQSITWE